MHGPATRRYPDVVLDLERLPADSLRPISRRDYERMVAAGLFAGERLELLHGLLLRMSPIGPAHSDAVRRLTRRFMLALGERAVVSPQCPFVAGDESVPEPDLALLPPGDYATAHPDRALLLVEVADSSLERDRGLKAALYAQAGVPEYWVVNLPDRTLGVYRDPRAGAYADVSTRRPGERVAPIAFPDLEVDVSEVVGEAPPPVGPPEA